jgi:hypothetical protein
MIAEKMSLAVTASQDIAGRASHPFGEVVACLRSPHCHEGGGTSMAKVNAGITISIDGYITGSDDGPGPSPRPSTRISPAPLPYRWEVDDDAVRISVSSGPLDATFTGSFDEGKGFRSGWRPNPGADESVNVPYDIGGHRVG